MRVRAIRRSGSCLVLALLAACGEEDTGVSFSEDVQPLLGRKCLPCHHTDNQLGLVDMGEPFVLDESPGLVGSLNVWEENHPGTSAKYNVTPYDPSPEASFIMEKITNPQLVPGACDLSLLSCRPNVAGTFMPPAQRRLPADQIALIREWISDGAQDSEFYRASVAPIFGDPFDLRRPGACSYCHYPGSPDSPDFTQAFDPVEGIVGVKAKYRGDLDLVVPGDPDNSFLVMKLEATEPSSALGAPMPREYEPLSDGEVATIGQWIAEGALDN